MMRRFAAAATLFAIALGGGSAIPAPHGAAGGHQRPPANRRIPPRAANLSRQSLAAVEAAGSGRATVTEVVGEERATASSWFAVPPVTAGGPATRAAAVAGEPADAVRRLASCLDPRAAAALFTVATEVRRLGPARVGGQVTVRYRLDVDLSSLSDRAAPEPMAELRQAGFAAVGVDIWLDQAKRPTRVSLTASGTDHTAMETVDCRYSHWGAGPTRGAGRGRR
ncbi:MAG: hypothetical protein HY241_15700 [Actinobacteria bacterium]|nr:hypothetical protein [Actinomycetota bacterium]